MELLLSLFSLLTIPNLVFRLIGSHPLLIIPSKREREKREKREGGEREREN